VEPLNSLSWTIGVVSTKGDVSDVKNAALYSDHVNWLSSEVVKAILSTGDRSILQNQEEVFKPELQSCIAFLAELDRAGEADSRISVVVAL
jgi:hypothetical protein